MRIMFRPNREAWSFPDLIAFRIVFGWQLSRSALSWIDNQTGWFLLIGIFLEVKARVRQINLLGTGLSGLPTQ
jgi:hypothetical protein